MPGSVIDRVVHRVLTLSGAVSGPGDGKDSASIHREQLRPGVEITKMSGLEPNTPGGPADSRRLWMSI